MNNDVLYLIVTIMGTIAVMFSFISRRKSVKILSATLASLFFLQAGVCVYKGTHGLHLKKTSDVAGIGPLKLSNNRTASR